MELFEFERRVRGANTSVSESTLRIWHAIHGWIEEHGYADTADTPAFVEAMSAVRSMSVATLNRHLRRMAAAGLLKGHALRRQLSPELKESYFNPILSLLVGAAPSLPSSFIRYCLPNTPCPRVFHAAERYSKAVDDAIARQRQVSVRQ